MLITHHPFQRSGAWAACELRGRAQPEELTPEDMDALVALIADRADLAARARRGEAGWAWLQKLAAMFAQAPPTHPRRALRLTQGADIAREVRQQFAPDDVRASWPCWACGAAASARWGKMLWPLAAPAGHVNTSQDRMGGLPVCRECRIAVWCLPWACGYEYGYLVSPGVANRGFEERFARAQTQLSEATLAEGRADWLSTSPWGDVDSAFTDLPPEPTQLLRWKSTNRDQELEAWDLTASGLRWRAALREHGWEGWARWLGGRLGASTRHPVQLAALSGWELEESVEILGRLPASRAGAVEVLVASRFAADRGEELSGLLAMKAPELPAARRRSL